MSKNDDLGYDDYLRLKKALDEFVKVRNDVDSKLPAHNGLLTKRGFRMRQALVGIADYSELRAFKKELIRYI